MRYRVALRILAGVALAVLVGWGPWWAALAAGIAFSWLFAPYYEGLLAGIAFDSLYGVRAFEATLIALAAFMLSTLLKRRTRF